jgi:hypothetical protein
MRSIPKISNPRSSLFKGREITQKTSADNFGVPARLTRLSAVG